jgi:hypothetical protein
VRDVGPHVPGDGLAELRLHDPPTKKRRVATHLIRAVFFHVDVRHGVKG